jgi:hypothetical protein
MSIMSRPTTTPYTNTVTGAEAVGQAYASIKVKTPDAYYRDRSKL